MNCARNQHDTNTGHQNIKINVTQQTHLLLWTRWHGIVEEKNEYRCFQVRSREMVLQPNPSTHTVAVAFDEDICNQ